MTTRFDGKTVLVTGGTGSFGQTMVNHLVSTKVDQVRVFSRDEAKQDALRHRLASEKIKYYLGDVRDPTSVHNAMQGVDFVFHAAALKQVPSAEFFPLEAVATNILGSANVIRAALAEKVESMVFLSTDKAVYPINAMGQSKALMEKTAVSFARNNPKLETKIAVTRYGNVMASRGSVIPLFISQIKKGTPITVTQGSMTRFLMSLDQSVDLVLHAFSHGSGGDLFVRKAPAATVIDLAKAVCILMDKPNHPIVEIGVRHGEKLFESLLSAEERERAIESQDYFWVPLDSRTLDYSLYVEKGNLSASAEAYTSHNTSRLTVPEIVSLLRSLPEIGNELP